MSMPPHDRSPLVGPVACRFLGVAFGLFGLFQLFVAQVNVHGGQVTELLTELIPLVGIGGAIIAVVGLQRLAWTYRALGLSAVCLVAWMVLTAIATSGE